MQGEDIKAGVEIVVPAGASGNKLPYRLRIDKVLMRSEATGAVEVSGTLLRMSGAPSARKRTRRVAILVPSRVRLASETDG